LSCPHGFKIAIRIVGTLEEAKIELVDSDADQFDSGAEPLQRNEEILLLRGEPLASGDIIHLAPKLLYEPFECWSR
jgi:hypothetical protein